MATFFNQATLSYNGTVTNSNLTTGELVASLGLTKTAISTSYGANEGISYVITVSNSTAAPISGLTVTDDLGAYTVGTETVYPLTYSVGSLHAYVGGAEITPPTVAVTQPLTLTDITIPSGETLVLVYEASTNAYTPLAEGSDITNRATVSGALGEASDTATVPVGEKTLLNIAKAICPQSVTAGDTVTYTFIIQNSGNTAADASAGVQVSDVFSPALSDIAVTLNGVPLLATDYTYNEESGTFATLPGVVTVPAASYLQDTTTGIITSTPGVAVLTVSGIIA